MFGVELEEGEIVDSPGNNEVENHAYQDMDMDIADQSESILIVRNKNTRLHLLGTQRQPLIKDAPVSYEYVPMKPMGKNTQSQGGRRATFRPRTYRRRQPLLSRDDLVGETAKRTPRYDPSTTSVATSKADTKRSILKSPEGQAGNEQQPTVEEYDPEEDTSLLLLRFQLLKSLNRKAKLSSEKASRSPGCEVETKSQRKRNRASKKGKKKAGGNLMDQQEKGRSFKRNGDAENRFNRSFPSRRNETCSRPNLLPTPNSNASALSPEKEETLRHSAKRPGDDAEPGRFSKPRQRNGSPSELDLTSEENELREYLIASMLENRRRKALLKQCAASADVVDGQSDPPAEHSKPEPVLVEFGKNVEPSGPLEADKPGAPRNDVTDESVPAATAKETTLPLDDKPSQQKNVIQFTVQEAPRRPASAKPVPSSNTTTAPANATGKQAIPQSHPLASFVRKERLVPGNRRYVRPLNTQENGRSPHSPSAITLQGNVHNRLNNRNRYKWTQAKSSVAQSNPVRPQLFQNRFYRKDAAYENEAYAAFVQQKQKPVIVVLDDADSSDEEFKEPPAKQQATVTKDSVESAVIAQAEKDASEALLAVYDSKVSMAGEELRLYEKKIEREKEQLYALRCQQNEEELYYRKSLALRAKLQKELEKLDEQIELHKVNMDATNKKIRVLQDVIEKGSVQKRLTELKWKSVQCASTVYKIKGGMGEQSAFENESAEGQEDRETIQNPLNVCVPQSSLTPEQMLMVRISESLSVPLTPSKVTTPVGRASPLMAFRSFRLLPAVMAAHGIPLSSPALSNNIDPMVVLCPYALNGSCASDDCPWQHPSDYELSQKEILFDLLSYHPEAVIEASGDESEVRSRLELYCKQLCQSFGQTETTDVLMKFCVTRMKNFLPSRGVLFEKRRFVCRPKRSGMKRWVGMTPYTDKSHTGSVSLCQIEDVSHILNKAAEARSRLWDYVAKTLRMKSLLARQGNSPKLWREFTYALADLIPSKHVLRHVCQEALRLAPGFETQVACFVGCSNFDEAFYTFRSCLFWLQRAFSDESQGTLDGRVSVVAANFLHSAIQLDCVTDAARVLQSEMLCSGHAVPGLDEDSAVSVWLMLMHVRLAGCLPNSVSIRHRDTITSSDIEMPWTYLFKRRASLLLELLYLACSRLGGHANVERGNEPLRRIYEPLLVLLAEASTKERLTFWIHESVHLLRHNKEFVAFLLFEPKFDLLNHQAVREEIVQACLKIHPQDFRFNYYWLTLLAKGQQWGDIIDFVAPLNDYTNGIFSASGDQLSMAQLKSAIANFAVVADRLGSHWEVYLILSLLAVASLKRISVARDFGLLRTALDEVILDLLSSPAEQLCYLREWQSYDSTCHVPFTCRLVELMRLFKVGQDFLPAIFRAVLLALSRAEQVYLGSLPKMVILTLMDFVSEVMPDQKNAILAEMLFRFDEEEIICLRLIDSLDADSHLWCHLVQSSAHKLLTIERYLTCIQGANRTNNRLLALFVLKHGLQAFPTCPELLCELEEMRASSRETKA